MRKDPNLYETEELVKDTLRDDKAYYFKNTICPLLGGLCSGDCICFVSPVSYKPPKAKKWRVTDWGCNNPMLMGVKDAE